MTWKEAIIKVLTDEGTPLHYSDITKRIIENGYRKPNEMGKTPEMTVSAQLTTKKNIFRKLGNGVFELLAPIDNKQSIDTCDSSLETTTEAQDMLSIEREHIIKGMFYKLVNKLFVVGKLHFGCF